MARRWGLWLCPAILCLLGLGCQESPSSPAPPRLAVEAGQDLFQRLACHGCHTLPGRSTDRGPDLEQAGHRLSPEALQTQLVTPRRRQANSRMPSFAFLPTRELQALVEYLQALPSPTFPAREERP